MKTTKTGALAAVATALLTTGQAGAAPTDPSRVIDRPAVQAAIEVDSLGRLLLSADLAETLMTSDEALEDMEELERVAGNWNCNCKGQQR